MSITFEQQADGTFRQVDDPPKRFDIEQMHRISELEEENKKLREQIQDAEHEESIAWDRARSAERRNDKLREQIELLITLLRNDCDIEASWDGLRKFWNIGLTESGCLMRDRACKVEAENAMLREELNFCLKQVPNCDGCEAMLDCWECLRADSSQKERKRLDYENEKLRELCRLFSEYVSYDRCDGCVCKSRCNDGEIDECWLLAEIREAAHDLGIDVH